jgi:preprotein translocase subunit SecE
VQGADGRRHDMFVCLLIFDDEKSMARVSPALFIRQVRQETAKVTWPTRKETTVTTIMVFVMVILASIFLFTVDQIIAFLVRIVLGLGG